MRALALCLLAVLLALPPAAAPIEVGPCALSVRTDGIDGNGATVACAPSAPENPAGVEESCRTGAGVVYAPSPRVDCAGDAEVHLTTRIISADITRPFPAWLEIFSPTGPEGDDTPIEECHFHPGYALLPTAGWLVPDPFRSHCDGMVEFN